LIFFRLLLSNCLNWKIYCDDHSLISYSNFIHCQRIYKIRVSETFARMNILFLFVFISTNIVF